MSGTLGSKTFDEIETRVDPAKVLCREIRPEDLSAVIHLLCEGFPARTQNYWQVGIDRISAMPVQGSRPRFGYILVKDTRIIGVLLLIFAPDALGIRANVSSWYVRPPYRAFAAMLVGRALHTKNVTYLNISPAPQTFPILLAQGYKRYVNGTLVCVPAFTRGGGIVEIFSAEAHGALFPRAEVALLCDHAKFGCIVLIVDAMGDNPQPFVFLSRQITKLNLRVAQLIYCRSTADFTQNAGVLGRRLLRRHGLALVILDTDAPIPGLFGLFGKGKKPKFAKGPNPPRPNDLAYTELAFFGR